MNLALGKLPAKIDRRTMMIGDFLTALPPIPDTFDVDSKYPIVKDDHVFANDIWGDCVKAMEAHGIERFEAKEQKLYLPITDDEVLASYWLEQGAHKTTRKIFCKTVSTWDSKPNNGLVILDSLNYWRKNGIEIGGKVYTIWAFASIDWKNHEQVKACIYLLDGIFVGFLVPQSALDQFAAGLPWTIVPGSPIRGGHGIYTPRYQQVVGYNEIGPVCITWGKPQQMKWDFWDTYVDESFAVIDNKDKWLNNSPVDVDAMSKVLAEITASV